MLYRRFRTPAGQFVEGLLTTDGVKFGVTGEVQAAQFAAAAGVPSLLFVDGNADPWDGVSVLFKIPPSAPSAETVAKAAAVAASAKLVADAIAAITADAALAPASKAAIIAMINDNNARMIKLVAVGEGWEAL